MSDIASDTPTVQDESIQAMNARLFAVVEKNLGFGVLEGTATRQLQVLPTPPPFCPYTRTKTEVKKVDNTATLQGAMDLEIITKTMPVAVDVAAQNLTRSEWSAIREESLVAFHFKRIIAMRSMPTPDFRDLLPVKRKTHLERGVDRWPVELYGNQICTTEYYGGEASISLRWNHDATVSTTRIISALNTAVVNARGSYELAKTSDLSGFRCRTDVKGFKLPAGVEGSSTTIDGVMNLIRVLTELPIETAVPVSIDTVQIQTVNGFPPSIHLETHIREGETLEKLKQVELQICKTEPLNVKVINFVQHLKEKVEDASVSNRPLLPQLRDLANTVAETLVQHGKRGELYVRHDELRLHTDNCSAKDVTAAGGETLCAVTLGVGVPAVRLYQSAQFEASPVWTVPEHYRAEMF